MPVRIFGSITCRIPHDFIPHRFMSTQLDKGFHTSMSIFLPLTKGSKKKKISMKVAEKLSTIAASIQVCIWSRPIWSERCMRANTYLNNVISAIIHTSTLFTRADLLVLSIRGEGEINNGLTLLRAVAVFQFVYQRVGGTSAGNAAG